MGRGQRGLPCGFRWVAQIIIVSGSLLLCVCVCVPQVALPKVKLLCVVEANEGAGPGPSQSRRGLTPSGNREPQNVQGRSWGGGA